MSWLIYISPLLAFIATSKLLSLGDPISVWEMLATVSMAIATVWLVLVNQKTVKVALRQVEESVAVRDLSRGLELYPYRKELIDIVWENDYEQMNSRGLDFNLLFSESWPIYYHCMELYNQSEKYRDALNEARYKYRNCDYGSLVVAAQSLEYASAAEIKHHNGDPLYFVETSIQDESSPDGTYLTVNEVEVMLAELNKNLEEKISELLISMENEVRRSIGLQED